MLLLMFMNQNSLMKRNASGLNLVQICSIIWRRSDIFSAFAVRVNPKLYGTGFVSDHRS